MVAKTKEDEESTKPRKKYRSVAGQPRIYQSPEAMAKDIDAYFADCDEENIDYSISGLVLALDFENRSSLFNYEGYSKEFSRIIRRAKVIVQDTYERDCRGKASQGCQFILNACFGMATNSQVHETREIEISLGDEERQLLQSMGSKLIESKIVGSVPLKELAPVPVERDE